MTIAGPERGTNCVDGTDWARQPTGPAARTTGRWLGRGRRRIGVALCGVVLTTVQQRRASRRRPTMQSNVHPLDGANVAGATPYPPPYSSSLHLSLRLLMARCCPTRLKAAVEKAAKRTPCRPVETRCPSTETWSSPVPNFMISPTVLRRNHQLPPSDATATLLFNTISFMKT